MKNYNIVVGDSIHSFMADKMELDTMFDLYRFFVKDVCIAEFPIDKINGWYQS